MDVDPESDRSLAPWAGLAGCLGPPRALFRDKHSRGRSATAYRVVFMRKPIVSRRETLRTLLAFLLVACGGAEAGSGTEDVTEVQNRHSIEGYPETISVKKGDSIGFMVHSPGG